MPAQVSATVPDGDRLSVVKDCDKIRVSFGGEFTLQGATVSPAEETEQAPICIQWTSPYVTPTILTSGELKLRWMPPGGLEDEFRKLVAEWKASRGPTSTAVKMALHLAYKKIISLGQAAVPLLLAELEREPDHWFLALHEITGANPVPKETRGRLKEMAAAWVAWGKANGFTW